jgi:signal transduction histidine kinase
VLGDGDRVLQIVTNLVSNALEATPADGHVAVDVALAEGVGRVIVSDTGPGIPEAERASVLRPFVTGDVRHGIGLGLPVASELAHAMGGTLVVGERPGGGAAFTLSLLLTGGSERAPGPPRNVPPDTQPASELVVE